MRAAGRPAGRDPAPSGMRWNEKRHPLRTHSARTPGFAGRGPPTARQRPVPWFRTRCHVVGSTTKRIVFGSLTFPAFDQHVGTRSGWTPRPTELWCDFSKTPPQVRVEHRPGRPGPCVLPTLGHVSFVPARAMVHAEGRDSYRPTLRDAESLLRRLVGVADVTVRSLAEIDVVPDKGASDRQITRNVVSALKARFGIDLDPAGIRITALPADNPKNGSRSVNGNGHAAAGSRALSRAEAPVSSESEIHDHGHAGEPALGDSAHRTAHMNGGNAPHEQDDDGLGAAGEPTRTPSRGTTAPAVVFLARAGRPRLEHVDVRPIGGSLRCRVVVATGNERFVSVADALECTSSDIELAARVTVDALRAARTPPDPLQLEGVILIDLAGRAHVVVSLSVWNGRDFDGIAGAEPIHGSTAEAAARAVITCVNGHTVN